jgi:formylglycine-generating enzyme required for sulfatase activity
MTNHLFPSLEWIAIPTGDITLIPNDADKKDSYLKTETIITVPAFEMTKHLITNAQFRPFVEAGGYEQKEWWTEEGWQARKREKRIAPRHWDEEQWNKDDYPVVGASWYDAIAFCRWLSDKTGQTITLPTDAQWSRGAGGEDGRSYAWGNEWDASRCNSQETGLAHTTPVSQYPTGASPYGVLDMSGNVWKWCLTGYETGTTETEGKEIRLLRGGCWMDGKDGVKITHRLRHRPNLRSYLIGFYVVKN